MTDQQLTRRRLISVAALAGAAVAAQAPLAPARAAALSQRTDYPFTLGVASGDPTPTGVVLWTRLAPKPLANDGGMPTKTVMVDWQVARDPNFRSLVRCGRAMATPALAHSVHVDVDGLRPNGRYWYRFRYGHDVSDVGRTRTTPQLGENCHRARIAFASCQRWDQGYYPSFADMVDQDPDLVVHLGDYVYEYAIPATGGLRQTPVPALLQNAPQKLNQWRQQYAWYKSDPDLQAAHRAAPWLVTWDDHEVINDYAGTTSPTEPHDISRLRTAAYQAWYEHQPVRASTRSGFESLRIYRRAHWGRLLQLDLIDGRQYRDVPPNGWGEQPNTPAAYDPSITLLGSSQERWLTDGIRNSSARWNLLGSNTMLARLDHDGDAGDVVWNDSWDGYPAARQRLIDTWRSARTRNPVCFTGDWHSTFVNDILADFDAKTSPTVASEFVGTSISSNGDAKVYGPYYGPMIKYNPHIKFFDGDRRGYQLATITPGQIRVDLRMVRTVATRSAPSYTFASFAVDDGVPGPKRI